MASPPFGRAHGHIHTTGGRARVLQFDIADRQQTMESLLTDIDEHGAYYGVVCNAGIARDNVLHPLVIPMLRLKQGGRIDTMASVSGLMGNRGQVNYSAAKAGIIGATKALAVELAKRKVTVNCVAPGIITTEMTEELPPQALDLVPLRRAGCAQEVADLVAFLISDKAAHITRQ